MYTKNTFSSYSTFYTAYFLVFIHTTNTMKDEKRLDVPDRGSSIFKELKSESS